MGKWVVLILTVLAALVLRVLNVSLWVWWKYRKHYDFPEEVYDSELHVPEDVRSGEEPFMAIGCLVGIFGIILGLVGHFIWENHLITVVGIILFAVPAALAAGNAMMDSTSTVWEIATDEAKDEAKDSAKSQSIRKKVELLRERLVGMESSSDALTLYRRCWLAGSIIDLHKESPRAAEGLASAREQLTLAHDLATDARIAEMANSYLKSMKKMEAGLKKTIDQATKP